MSHAANGRAREHRIRDDMIRRGWMPIMRAAGSKGAADLLMAHPDHGPALIQVGSASKTLGPAERARLLIAARLCGALAICARTQPGIGIHYAEVTADVPSRWPVYYPGPLDAADP